MWWSSMMAAPMPTLRELLKALDVMVVRHSTNLGKGQPCSPLLNMPPITAAEYLITLDGDGQHFPEDLSAFLSRLSPIRSSLGSRDEIVGIMPRSSRFGREFSDFWICIETGARLCDIQSGFRAYPLRHVLSLEWSSRHYNLEMEIITRAVWAGLAIQSVSIRVWYPDRPCGCPAFGHSVDNFRISLLHTRLVLRRLLPIPTPDSRFRKGRLAVRRVQWFKR